MKTNSQSKIEEANLGFVLPLARVAGWLSSLVRRTGAQTMDAAFDASPRPHRP